MAGLSRKVLTLSDFAESFGEHDSGFLTSLAEKIENQNLTLIPLSPSQRDELILSVIRVVLADTQVVGSQKRRDVWDKGWSENLELFESNESQTALIPKFMRPGKPIRWAQEWYRPVEPDFEVRFVDLLRTYVFNYFRKFDITELHEFGAGSGWNLAAAAGELGGHLKLIGSDFVPSSVNLLASLGPRLSLSLEAREFDMLSPNSEYDLPRGAGVLTFGALEQLAGNIQPMIEFLISKKPKLIFSIEPAAETYDLDNLPDFLAHWFQTKRGYSTGLVKLLKEKESQGMIEILKIKRTGFGSQFMEGYTLFVWRVK